VSDSADIHDLGAGNPESPLRAHGNGRAGETGCGAAIEVALRFAGQDFIEAWVSGAGPDEALEAAQTLEKLLKGSNWQQAASISPEHLAAEIQNLESSGNSGLEQETGWRLPGAGTRHRARQLVAAGFAVEALHRAFEDALRRDTFPVADQTDENTVLVAMSGGVDSSVACLMEKERGRQVIGLTMRLWSDPACQEDTGSSCCSPLSIRDARAVCHQLGIPHLTVDLAGEFEEMVVEPFVQAYLSGQTPNPCTACNGNFRFPELVALADRLGAARVASGHYACITCTPAGARIARGADAGKDQSYMLWAISPPALERLEFPLGEINKDETRTRARQAALPTHARPESQDICFIPDGDHRRFLRSRSVALPGPGRIVGADGVTIGRHTGFTDYTVGQRRGLGGGATEPLFVIATRTAENEIVAGTHEELAVSSVVIRNVNMFVPADELVAAEGLSLQARYRSEPVAARVQKIAEGQLTIKTQSPLFGVAPGQSAVLYCADEVLAAGIIVSAN